VDGPDGATSLFVQDRRALNRPDFEQADKAVAPGGFQGHSVAALIHLGCGS
jgi:hypothetical protein